MRPVYSLEQLAYLREGYKLMDLDTLTAAFNREFKVNKTRGQIKSALQNHKMVCGRKPGHTTGTIKAFTLEQSFFIEELYKSMTRKQIVLALKEFYDVETTEEQIKAFTTNHKILSGRTGCFEKGIVPWNTGIKGSIKPNSGSFKKGSIPPNLKPFGHERICSKDDYVLVKVDERNPSTGFRGRYKHKHVIVYEQHFGPVPEGKIISFVDGDKRNFDPKNLEAIDRNLLCRMNKKRVYDLPKTLIPTMKAIVKLENKMVQKSRSNHS